MKISILSAKKQMSNQESAIEVSKSQKVKKAIAARLQENAVDVSPESVVENLAHNAGIKTNNDEVLKKKAETAGKKPAIKAEPKKRPAVQKAEASLEGTRALNLMIIDYSEKRIAVIGDTKCIKDELKALNGWFIRRLCPFGIELSVSGWTFPKEASPEVEKLVNKYKK